MRRITSTIPIILWMLRLQVISLGLRRSSIGMLKFAYYGGKVRMTQAKMEEFFDEPTNFVNP